MLLGLFVIAALAVIQGSTTPPSNREDGLCAENDNSLVYKILNLAGYNTTCVEGVLDYCFAGQDGCHFMPLVQVSVRVPSPR